jgi:sporulation protein YlmC with PRC-barrel domain
MSDTLKQSTATKLIAAADVEGAAVFDVHGEKIGTVRDVYIDKCSGQTEFVSMASGGVLGIGEKYHALPWSALAYDSGLNGYLVGLDKSALVDGPVFDEEELEENDTIWGDEVREYYARMAEQPLSTVTDADHSVHTPHARRIDPPDAADEKVDHLAARVEKSESRQEALLDEAVEESFPASDPVSAKRIT